MALLENNNNNNNEKRKRKRKKWYKQTDKFYFVRNNAIHQSIEKNNKKRDMNCQS